MKVCITLASLLFLGSVARASEPPYEPSLEWVRQEQIDAAVAQAIVVLNFVDPGRAEQFADRIAPSPDPFGQPEVIIAPGGRGGVFAETKTFPAVGRIAVHPKARVLSDEELVWLILHEYIHIERDFNQGQGPNPPQPGGENPGEVSGEDVVCPYDPPTEEEEECCKNCNEVEVFCLTLLLMSEAGAGCELFCTPCTMLERAQTRLEDHAEACLECNPGLLPDTSACDDLDGSYYCWPI